MLMMQRNSGLTRLEVRQARLQLDRDTRIQKLHLGLRPVLIAGCGLMLGLLGAHVAWLAIALIAVAFLLVAGILATTGHAWLQRFDNADTPVLMIREGLIRQGSVEDLVPGDTLVVSAGSVLPVDVTGIDTALPKFLAVVLAALGLDQVGAIAGSVAVVDGHAIVTAVGNQRLVLATALPALAATPEAGVKCLVQLLVAVCHQAIATTCHMVAFSGQQVARRGHAAAMRLTAALVATRMTLIGNVRHAASESAFRYNQDPVSWASI